MQIDRQRQPGSGRQYPIEVRIGGVLAQAAAHEKHTNADGAGRTLPVCNDVGDRRISRVDRFYEGKPVRDSPDQKDESTRGQIAALLFLLRLPRPGVRVFPVGADGPKAMQQG
jgi:hypothetical protein